jgi:hypothetical protein
MLGAMLLLIMETNKAAARQGKEIRKRIAVRMSQGWTAEQIGARIWKCYGRLYEVRNGNLHINISGTLERFDFTPAE